MTTTRTGILDEIRVSTGDHPGPTGRFREVLRAHAVDAGDNVIEENITSAAEFAALLRRWRGGPLYLIDDALGEECEGVGGEYLCGQAYQGQG